MRPIRPPSWLILNIFALLCGVGQQRCTAAGAVHDGPAATLLRDVRLCHDGQTHAFRLWAACNDAQRAQGLMGRRTLAPAQGMIFVFGDEAPRTFWMHNTPLSLDLLFFDAAGRLTCIMDRAEPMTDTPRVCALPSATVVELPAGTAAALHFGTGTTLDAAAVLPKALCPRQSFELGATSRRGTKSRPR